MDNAISISGFDRLVWQRAKYYSDRSDVATHLKKSRLFIEALTLDAYLNHLIESDYHEHEEVKIRKHYRILSGPECSDIEYGMLYFLNRPGNMDLEESIIDSKKYFFVQFNNYTHTSKGITACIRIIFNPSTEKVMEYYQHNGSRKKYDLGDVKKGDPLRGTLTSFFKAMYPEMPQIEQLK